MDDFKIYSVSEITIYIKNLIERDEILQDIFVRGEISNLRLYNKHLYFTLKDENSVIECAMFNKKDSELSSRPKEGAKAIIKGYAEVYRKRGAYQLIVEEIKLIGEGELYLKFLELKKKLGEEGLFDEKFKKPMPKFPKKIGIVTSLEGAVIKDIINVIERRYPYVKLIIYPSLVQGDEAKYTIARGIEVLNEISVDVIIVARGGGSFEDLWPFNEEIVARAAFNSKIPVISAIGHETDFTILDFVADKRAPTPSAAAEIAVPNKEEIFYSLNNFKDRINKSVTRTIEFHKEQISYIKNRIVFKRPFILIGEYKQSLDEKKSQLIQTISSKFKLLKTELRVFKEKVNSSSPYSILKKGYTLTIREGKVISSIKNINENDIFFTIFKDGEISSKVQGKNEREII